MREQKRGVGLETWITTMKTLSRPISILIRRVNQMKNDEWHIICIKFPQYSLQTLKYKDNSDRIQIQLFVY